jgi:hypothetical protein
VIALAKIVGFEVAPLTAKSRTSRAKSPVSSSSRERVSSQIETPASCKRCSRFIVPRSVSCRCRSTFGLLAFGADPHDVPGEVAALQTADEPGAGIQLQATQAVTG